MKADSAVATVAVRIFAGEGGIGKEVARAASAETRRPSFEVGEKEENGEGDGGDKNERATAAGDQEVAEC